MMVNMHRSSGRLVLMFLIRGIEYIDNRHLKGRFVDNMIMIKSSSTKIEPIIKKIQYKFIATS